MKIIKTASGKSIKISKPEWEEMGKKAGWMKKALLYDDLFEIKGKVMQWVEKYMDNYPEEEWIEKQALLYRDIAKFCIEEANGLNSEAGRQK